MILGVTGLIGSGKGAVADFLVEKGFIKLGHSGIIAEEIKKRGLVINRNTLVAVGNEMRRIYGLDYWAKKLIENLESGRNYVVEGFRNVSEVEAFRNIPGFFLLGVAAGKSRRCDWIIKRGKAGDPTTLEEFEQRERIDFLQGVPEGQQNALCFSMADRYILNERTLEELNIQIEKVLKDIFP